MTKKSRKTLSIAFEKEAIGQFLLHLYDLQTEKPETDWSISKQEVRTAFLEFLNLPENVVIRKRMPKIPAKEIGVLLRRTAYLIDKPKGCEFFCIRIKKFLQFKEINELHQEFEKKLVMYNAENQKLHRLSTKSNFHITTGLPQFLPTPEILSLKKGNYPDEALCEFSPKFADYLNGGRIFTPENMFDAMKMLLRIEDMNILHRYHLLIQRNVKLAQSSDRYIFTLSGKSRHLGCANDDLLSRFNRVLVIPECKETNLLPKREYLEFLMSGSLDFKSTSIAIETTFLGRIEMVEGKQVTLVMDGNIKLEPKPRYLIIFYPARVTLRYQYNALEIYKKDQEVLNRFLFPEPSNAPTLSEICLSFYNKNIAANPEQKQAVKNIVSISKNKHLSSPFVIFGPPGTGKTSMMVETILQLLHEPDAKILVTAGPNCACDEIALRICNALALGKEPRSQILARVYCFSQEQRRENMNKLLLEYSNMYDWHFYPDLEVLQSYRVVVCTLSAVGKLAMGSLKHFTHVFHDEAGACSLSESLVGLVSALGEKSQLIIAGDHKQLGAIVKSDRAEQLGLGVSLMERLLDRKCYDVVVDGDNEQYERSIQTRLCRNFRSHPAIVKLFSHLYYEDKLLAMAPKEQTNWAENWKVLKDKDFPILFQSVRGKEEVDEDTGSLANWKEVLQVMRYVDDLLENGLGDGRKLEESDIGIISPYRNQYMTIQEELNVARKFQIETGSAEIYRGKEKAVIIASFVRSRTKSIGFLKNPKRLNVILSRAKSLLILIGNDETLSQQGDYEFIIKECQRRGNFLPDPTAFL
uniref:Putative helicase mov-10-B.2 n=1 Tax=Ceratitis capitata TaxID=7213 RepID=W8BBF1_CERCA